MYAGVRIYGWLEITESNVCRTLCKINVLVMEAPQLRANRASHHLKLDDLTEELRKGVQAGIGSPSKTRSSAKSSRCLLLVCAAFASISCVFVVHSSYLQDEYRSMSLQQVPFESLESSPLVRRFGRRGADCAELHGIHAGAPVLTVSLTQGREHVLSSELFPSFWSAFSLGFHPFHPFIFLHLFHIFHPFTSFTLSPHPPFHPFTLLPFHLFTR